MQQTRVKIALFFTVGYFVNDSTIKKSYSLGYKAGYIKGILESKTAVLTFDSWMENLINENL